MGKQWTPPTTDQAVQNNSQWTPPSSDEELKKKGQPLVAISTPPPSGDGLNLSQNSLTDFSQNQSLPYAPLVQQERVAQVQRDKEAYQAKQKQMQETLQAYAASGNASPQDLVDMAKRAQSSELNGTITTPTDRTVLDKTGDFIQNQIWIPTRNNVLAPFNKELSDLTIKPLSAVTTAIENTIGTNDAQANEDTDNLASGRKKASFADYFKVFGRGIRQGVSDLNQNLTDVSKSADETNEIMGADRGVAGDVIANVSGALPLIAGLSTGQTEVNGGYQMISGLTKLLAAKGALNSYKDASDQGETGSDLLTSTVKGGGEGAVQGLTLDAQMLLGGALGKEVANKLAEYGLLKAGKASEALLHSFAVGTVFSGTSVAQDLANGEDPEQIQKNALNQFFTGMAFELPKVIKGGVADIGSNIKNNKANDNIIANGVAAQSAKELNDQSLIRNLMGFDPKEIAEINSNPTSADDLYAQSLIKGEQAYNTKNPQEKRDLMLQQLSLKNQADIKHVTERIITNPQGFLQGVFESDLPVEAKTDLMNKVSMVNKLQNPVELHKLNLSKQISDIDSQVNLIDAHATATQGDPIAQAQSLDTKNKLVQLRTQLSLDLLNIANSENNNQAKQSILKNIEAKRNAELLSVEIPHVALENTGEGTFDVLKDNEIISQHPTRQEAEQTAADLNQPAVNRINDINQQYDQEAEPFREAQEVGLIKPEVQAPAPVATEAPIVEPESTINTSIGKLKIEPASETELAITTPDGVTKNYSIEDAVDAFDIPQEDLQKIAQKYVGENRQEPNSQVPSEQSGNVPEPKQPNSSENDQGRQPNTGQGKIPSETTGVTGEQEAINESAVAGGVSETSPVDKYDINQLRTATNREEFIDVLRKITNTKQGDSRYDFDDTGKFLDMDGPAINMAIGDYFNSGKTHTAGIDRIINRLEEYNTSEHIKNQNIPEKVTDQSFKNNDETWTHLTNSKELIESILAGNAFLGKGEDLANFTKEISTKKFNINKENGGSPYFQKGKFYGTPSQEYLITTRGDEKFTPNINRTNASDLAQSGNVGVLNPEFRDAGNFDVWKKGDDGEFYKIEKPKSIERTPGQQIADKVRSLEIKSSGLQSNILGVPVAIWNAGIKTVAAAIETGEKISDAIKRGIKYIRDNHKTDVSDKEIEDQIRNGILNKPTRNENEGYHEYASRVLEWKRALKDNENLSTALKKEATKAAAPESLFNNQVKKGVDVLRKDITTNIEDFNRAVGAKEGSTEHYVAAIKELINSDSIKKVNAERILDSLRQGDPKKIIATEASLLKRSLREREKAATQGYREARAETKQSFLEYDAAKKTENKERIAGLKAKYESKLDAEKQARADQVDKIKSVHNTIRSEVRDILSGLNKSRLLGGVNYSDKDIINFSNRLNNVVTEKGIDKFKDFITKSLTNADHGRDVNEIRSGIRKAKGLLDKDYVPQNIKSIIKDIAALNPDRANEPKRLRAILTDINNSQNVKEFASIPEAEMIEFVKKERDNDLDQRRNDIIQDHRDILDNNDKYDIQNFQGNTNLIHSSTLKDLTNSIVKDDKTTYNEKVKKLNQVEDALGKYKKDLEESVDEKGNIINTPQDFLTTLDNIKNKPDEISESQRDSLEDVVSAKQDLIETNTEGLSPEQRASLETLKQVPLAGQDANTLRLFNNILENVTNNDDHSGMLIMEAKAIGNSKEGALKAVDYLNGINKTPRSVKGGNKILEASRQLRSVGENISALMTRFSNNDFKFLNAMQTGTHFDQIQNGLARADHEFQEKVAKKLEGLFKQYPEIARNPEAIQKLSLFSYLNQYREFASPEQQNKEIQKRVSTINKDIILKEGGLDAEKGEAEIEKGIWDNWAEKIKDETDVDVHDKESLKNLTYEDLSKIEFLNEGEKKIYDTYRTADNDLRPDHEKVTNGINKSYETWANHMRDGYRFLGSGLVDVLGTDNLGFQASDNSIDSASDSTAQRVKGDPLAQKSGEKQKVLNMNFFNVQDQGIKNMLYDIHTLKDRMIFDESMKNKDLQEAIGNENHKFYQEAVKNYVLTDMGLGKGTGEKELKLIKQGLNVVTKLGTYKQLLSLSAYVKQATATIVNTLAYTGFDAKLMYQANQEMGTPAINELLKKHPISRRAENQANLNILSDKGIGDVNNIVDAPGKGVVSHTIGAIENFANKYFLHLEKNGTSKEPWITKPIKLGDVKTAEWSWVTHYADYLLKNGKAKDFNDINWEEQAKNPDREAANYAEQITSKQLNENTKAGRSKLINSNNIGLTAAKAVLFPFGSFNMHKYQTLVENMRTLTSKDTYVNKESFKNQGMEAVKSLMSNFVEESAFQGLKIGIGLSLTPMLKAGLAYTLGSVFGTPDETQGFIDQINKQRDKKASEALQSWLGNTIGNQFFGGLGNTPQDAVQKTINWAAKKAGVENDLFIEPKISIDKQVSDASQAGMISSALSGNLDRGKDLYRIIDNKDKYNVPVDITPMQKAIIATSIFSDVMAMAGMNDADLNRSIDQLRKSVDQQLAIKFKDPNYRDQNEQRPLKISGKNIMLSPDHVNYYEQRKADIKQDLIDKKIDSKRAATIAAERAKMDLLRKYGQSVIKEGKEIKSKKK